MVSEQTERENKSIDIETLLHSYLKTAKRMWWLLLVGIVLCAALVPLTSAWLMTPEYKASCSFTVKVVNNSVTDEIDGYYGIYYDKDLAEQLEKTFSYILTSDHLSDEVYQKLDKELKADKITATCIKGSNLFVLEAVAATPEEAVDLLETVMAVFPDAARYVVGDLKVEELEAPNAKSTPSNAKNWKAQAALGAMAGFLLISAVLVWLAWNHRTVHKPEQLEDVLNMPCVGLVPLTSACTGALDDGESRESIRGIARKIENALESKGLQVILVTSTQPDEGKTLVARMVAQTLADWGKKVCLVDGDLRKPSLYKYYKLHEETLPLVSALQGQVPLKSVMRSVGENHLALVGNTQSTDDPTMLLDGPMWQSMMSHLRNHTDVIIIDAPPCETLADVTLLQKSADRILYVVRQDCATIDRVVNAVEGLSKDEGRLLGFVLNGTVQSAGGYGKYGYGTYSYGKYGGGYYGKYGYYHGYNKH